MAVWWGWWRNGDSGCWRRAVECEGLGECSRQLAAFVREKRLRYPATCITAAGERPETGRWEKGKRRGRPKGR